MKRLLLVLFLIASIIPLTYASPNDGVCDVSDVLAHSLDCSAAVYLTTTAGAPVSKVVLPAQSTGSAILTFDIVNLDLRKAGVLCISSNGLTLYTSEGNQDQVCAVVPPGGTTVLNIGVRYSSSSPGSKIGELVVTTVDKTYAIPVYTAVRLSGVVPVVQQYAVPIALIVFSLLVYILTRFYYT